MSTVDLSTPHRATLSLTGLPPVTNHYSHTGSWPTVDSWTASAGATVAAISGLRITVTGAAGTTYAARTVSSVAGSDVRRVRALVRNLDPESRPVAVGVSSNTAGHYPEGMRLVSGVPVWVEGFTTMDGPTSVRIYVDLPAGASSAAVVVEEVIFDRIPVGDWFVRRTDANGVAMILGGPYPGPMHPNPGAGSFAQQWADPDASGNLTFTDDDASLVGSVSWFVEKDGYSGDETLTGTLAKTGYAVVHRVHEATPTLHAVTLVRFSGTYQGMAEPVQILGSELPTMATAPLGSRVGTIVLYFDTLDAAEAVAADLRTGEVMMLRQPATGRIAMDAYLVATALDVSVVLEELAEPKWSLTATYVETARGTS